MAQVVTKEGWSILHLAAVNNQLKTLETLYSLPEIAALATKINQQGWTALHHAVEKDYLDVALSLIKQYPAMAQVVTKVGSTILHLAARSNQLKTLETLYSLPEITAVATKTDQQGWTPLHCAVAEDYLDVTLSLIKQYPVMAQAVTKVGSTILHLAAANNQLNTLKILYSLPAITALATKTDQQDWTPLHYAVAVGYLDVALSLIKQYPAMAQAVTQFGSTIFHIAARNNQLKTLETLYSLPKIAALATKTDQQGWTALHYTVAKGYLDVALSLIKQYPAMAQAVTKEGRTILQFAADYKQQDTLEALQKLPAMAA
jgi:ankyrin repeat protein